MGKFWVLIQDKDKHGHFSAWVRPVTSSDNIASVLAGYPGMLAANIYPTKKEAFRIATMLNQNWKSDGVYRWDFMDDGTTPAPF